MNFVYIDESGNTGLNLKDSQQPIFILAGMIIPESKWFLLEKLYFEIIRKYWGDISPYSFEIKAQYLKSGRGPFKEMKLEEQLAFRDEILELLVSEKIFVVYRRIIKKKFAEFCDKHYGPGIKVNPYVMALPFICMEIDHYLQQIGSDELGMLIFDEQKEIFEAELVNLIKSNQVSPETPVWRTGMKDWLKESTSEYPSLKGIGTGGNINKILKMSLKEEGDSLTYKNIKKVYDQVNSYSFEDRISKLNLRPDRADVIIPATKIFLKVIKWTDIQELYVPSIGLSDGIIHVLYERQKEMRLKA